MNGTGFLKKEPGEALSSSGPANWYRQATNRGKVFHARKELEFIADLLSKEFDAICLPTKFTDIIYGYRALGANSSWKRSISQWRRFEQNARANGDIVIHSPKTYSITGWRVSYVIAPHGYYSAVASSRFSNGGSAANPLQHAGAYCRSVEELLCGTAKADISEKRLLIPVLQNAGIKMRVATGRVLHGDDRRCEFRFAPTM